MESGFGKGMDNNWQSDCLVTVGKVGCRMENEQQYEGWLYGAAGDLAGLLESCQTLPG
jgi:hypothetical protein